MRINKHPAPKRCTGLYLWWSLYTLYLLACQMRVTIGDSGLCCSVCVSSSEHYLTPLFVDTISTLTSNNFQLVLFATVVLTILFAQFNRIDVEHLVLWLGLLLLGLTSPTKEHCICMLSFTFCFFNGRVQSK